MSDLQQSVRPSVLDAAAIGRAGRMVAIAGVVLPLVFIGAIKFQQFEIDALKPLFAATPWLAWLPALFGDAGASYFLGVVELITAALVLASPWSARAGVAGGALGTLTFALSSSVIFALPVWEASVGGFPFINGTGSFLIKDVALLGISIALLGDSLARLRD